ncbi:trypsin-like peptidase domain-containing protein [Streptomyces sp. V4-01]|uniref:Trypsin-like peptidase domain-containing protein n=1 Tax=Actinacidiphila polyblastidii TaxID=3110430 RepID=A0ABU7P521_9ACTN|nr:trypsin-like peptidase domain-containing protein [Streptomyces sp. V4-01]
MTAAPDGAEPALWVGGADGFRGSAFHLGGGSVVTAAHVVTGGEPATALAVGGGGATHSVTAARATPPAPPAPRTRFHPFPDLALLTVPCCAGLPAARLAPADPPPGAAVTAVGHSTDTPSPGVQPDTLSLRVGGRSGAYLRVLGDGVHAGLSGSTLVSDATGLVGGVVKGSRSYRHVQGGWFTPVSALRAFLGPKEAEAAAQVPLGAQMPTGAPPQPEDALSASQSSIRTSGSSRERPRISSTRRMR